MLTLLLASLIAEPLPCPKFAEVLPVPQFVDPAPAPVVMVTTPQVVYRIGSLPPTWVPPSPPVYYQPAPVVTGYAPPAYCVPGQR